MLVTYVPFGDPDLRGEDHLERYARAGADVLEVGIPSPTPHLDGPIVANSMRRAIDLGFDIDDLADRIRKWRKTTSTKAKVVWMSYGGTDLGDVEKHVGTGSLDGVLVADAGPPAEYRALISQLAGASLGWCSFVPWCPSDDELEFTHAATGYVMVQSRPGTTGVGAPNKGLKTTVERVRQIKDVPVVAGFGIRTSDDIALSVAAGADGVVIGTKCVEALSDGPVRLEQAVCEAREWLNSAIADETRGP